MVGGVTLVCTGGCGGIFCGGDVDARERSLELLGDVRSLFTSTTGFLITGIGG